jgi:hypothetical protein
VIPSDQTTKLYKYILVQDRESHVDLVTDLRIKGKRDKRNKDKDRNKDIKLRVINYTKKIII